MWGWLYYENLTTIVSNSNHVTWINGMNLQNCCEYLKEAAAKTRLVMVPSSILLTKLRRFYHDHNIPELRLSDYVYEDAWLPMPDEVFVRIRQAAHDDMLCTVLGVSGYLSLLTNDHQRNVAAILRRWVDDADAPPATFLLYGGEREFALFNDVFTNPRYRLGKQIIQVDKEGQSTDTAAGRTEIMLVGQRWREFIPQHYDTFQSFLRTVEDQPNAHDHHRIAVASDRKQLAGIHAEVRQIMTLQEFAKEFYDVDDPSLSDDALNWIIEHRNVESETYFSDGKITKEIIRKFDQCGEVEREVILWETRNYAPSGSYLEYVIGRNGLDVKCFRSAYIAAAQEVLDRTDWIAERQRAIEEAGVLQSDADIRQFIKACAGESTTRVAPWLQCGTDSEKVELLRRCAVDGIISNAVKAVYPEVAFYTSDIFHFGRTVLDDYFREYREQKITGKISTEFCAKAMAATIPEMVPSRSSLIQKYASDSSCALLVIDAMGAEYLPMLVALARERNIGITFAAIATANLPTTTEFNVIDWPELSRRLPDVKRFDNIAHNGVELHEIRAAEENIAAELAVIGTEILPRVAEALKHNKFVLVTADHGYSRLAVLAHQSQPKLSQTLTVDDGVVPEHLRYRVRGAASCPPEMEESFDGAHWSVRGYNRLPRRGTGFGVHGGATLEERLVPVVVFSHTNTFVPKSKAAMEIVENDDFDL